MATGISVFVNTLACAPVLTMLRQMGDNVTQAQRFDRRLGALQKARGRMMWAHNLREGDKRGQ